MTDDLTRPIIGIENRTAQEVFDIMCDRINHRLQSLTGKGRVGVTQDMPLSGNVRDACGKLHDIMCLPDGASISVARQWASEARSLLTQAPRRAALQEEEGGNG